MEIKVINQQRQSQRPVPLDRPANARPMFAEGPTPRAELLGICAETLTRLQTLECIPLVQEFARWAYNRVLQVCMCAFVTMLRVSHDFVAMRTNKWR